MRGIDTFLALKEQTDLFTPKALADLVSGDFLAFNTEGLSGKQQNLSDKSIRRQAMQSRSTSFKGTMEAGGSLEFTASNFVLEKVLPLIFHSKTGESSDAAGATYSLVDGGVLPSFTAFVGFDGPEGEYTRRFTGAKVNRASIAARVNEQVSITTELAAINKEILNATTTAVYPGGDVEYAYVFSNARVEIKAGDMSTLAELPVESFNININHQLSTDKYRLGSVFRRSLQEGQTMVDGDFTLDAASKSVSGAPLSLTGAAINDPAFMERLARDGKYAALKFTVIDPSREVTPGVNPKLEISLPYIRLEEPDFQVKDTGLITGTARFTAYDNLTIKHTCKLTA